MPGELLPEENHPRHPEENDVVASLKESAGVEHFQVVSLVRPAENGEREQAGTEPSVQDVFVLLQRDLGLVNLKEFGCLGQSIFLGTSGNPVVIIGRIWCWLSL